MREIAHNRAITHCTRKCANTSTRDAHDVLLQYGKLTFWCTGKKSKQIYYGSSDESDNDGGEDTRTSRRKRQLTSRVNAREERKTRVND